jgi:tryptophan-rich sensory protein
VTKLKIIPLLFSVGICFLAAALGSAFTIGAIDTWYVTLNKPFFSPPNWVFGPVWTLLYLMMGISLYLVWITKIDKKTKRQAITFFFIQLGLNALWSILFFGLKSPSAAFVGIVLLWLAIFLTIKNFLKISRVAGWLLIPYLVWVSFATILNLSILLLNR